MGSHVWLFIFTSLDFPSFFFFTLKSHCNAGDALGFYLCFAVRHRTPVSVFCLNALARTNPRGFRFVSISGRGTSGRRAK